MSEMLATKPTVFDGPHASVPKTNLEQEVQSGSLAQICLSQEWTLDYLDCAVHCLLKTLPCRFVLGQQLLCFSTLSV